MMLTDEMRDYLARAIYLEKIMTMGFPNGMMTWSEMSPNDPLRQEMLECAERIWAGLMQKAGSDG